jgi:hypothetical protein
MFKNLSSLLGFLTKAQENFFTQKKYLKSRNPTVTQ